jgi:hypothetical protein
MFKRFLPRLARSNSGRSERSEQSNSERSERSDGFNLLAGDGNGRKKKGKGVEKAGKEFNPLEEESKKQKELFDYQIGRPPLSQRSSFSSLQRSPPISSSESLSLRGRIIESPKFVPSRSNLHESLSGRNPYRHIVREQSMREVRDHSVDDTLIKHSENPRSELLRKQRDKLREINERLSEMGEMYEINADFQKIARDNRRDSPKMETIIHDLGASSQDRTQQRDIYRKKLQADKLIFNGSHSQASRRIDFALSQIPYVNAFTLSHTISRFLGSPTLGGWHNRIRHSRGHKLQEKVGSAALTTDTDDREFPERDWDTVKIMGWSRQLDKRLEALNTLERSGSTDYTSRYQFLESPVRIPEAKYVYREDVAEVRDAIHEVTQQLRDEKGLLQGKKGSAVDHLEQRVRELYDRLPLRQIEKWHNNLRKEQYFRDNPLSKKREKRTTTFESLSDDHLKRLIAEADKQVKALKYARKLENAVAKRPIRNLLVSRRKKDDKFQDALESIPPDLRGRALLLLSGKKEYRIWKKIASYDSEKKGTEKIFTLDSVSEYEIQSTRSRDDFRLELIQDFIEREEGNKKGKGRSLKKQEFWMEKKMEIFEGTIQKNKHIDPLPSSEVWWVEP